MDQSRITRIIERFRGPDLRRSLPATLLVVLLPAVVGAGFALTEGYHRLEERLGLYVLFKARGERAPPSETVIVNIDSVTDDVLQLPRTLREWPRSVHACVLDELVEAGAALVVFDINFVGVSARTDVRSFDPTAFGSDAAAFFRARCRERFAHPDPDAAFADAIRSAGNVLLVQPFGEPLPDRVRNTTISCRGFSARRVVADANIPAYGATGIDAAAAYLTPLNKDLTRDALAWAPFGLPNEGSRINWTWLYLSEVGHLPTLPLVTLELYHQRLQRRALDEPAAVPSDPYAAGSEYLNTGAAHVSTRVWNMAERRSKLRASVDPADEDIGEPVVSDPLGARLQALAAGGDCRYLNFHGPAGGSIRALSYQELLGGNSDRSAELHDKIVFVGFAETFSPSQKDWFNTAFTRDGVNLAGVEILATTFSNLLNGESVQRPDLYSNVFVTLLWGLLLGVIARCVKPGPALIVLPTLGGAFAAGAYVAFTRSNLWLPLAVPIAIVLPLALYLGASFHYGFERLRQRAISEVLRRHFPAGIEKKIEDGRYADGEVQECFGVCIATDAEGFTDVSNRHSPATIMRLLDAYYETIVRPIVRRGGLVIDSAGDGLLSVITETNDQPGAAQRGVEAAVEILDGIDSFNERNPATPLPTRIGINLGPFALGCVGSPDRVFFKAVGDTINVAARIEAANKHFGTHLLAACSVTSALTGEMLIRYCGPSRVKGKADPVSLAEIIGWKQQASPEMTALCMQFDAPMKLFTECRWAEAARAFHDLASRYPSDGPTRTFMIESEKRAADAGSYQSAVIDVGALSN